MCRSNPATKTVSREDVQDHFDELLQQAARDNVYLTIEENGRPVAVLTPFDLHERRQARKRFLEMVEEIQEQANLSADDADELALEAIRAIRNRSA